MTVKNQELYNIIEALPEEISIKVMDYIEYLKYTYISSKGPEDLIIKDKEDLREKLEEGIKDSDNGKVCSLDETFSEIDKLLAN